MGHLLACRLITILMDWDCSDSSACVTLTGREGGRAEKTGVKAILEGRGITGGRREQPLGLTTIQMNMLQFSYFWVSYFLIWVIHLKIKVEPRSHFTLFTLQTYIHPFTLSHWGRRDDFILILHSHTGADASGLFWVHRSRLCRCAEDGGTWDQTRDHWSNHLLNCSFCKDGTRWMCTYKTGSSSNDLYYLMKAILINQ